MLTACASPVQVRCCDAAMRRDERCMVKFGGEKGGWWGPSTYMAVCQNPVPLVNIKIAGKWMFIPLKMVLIGIDPYPYLYLLLLDPIVFFAILAHKRPVSPAGRMDPTCVQDDDPDSLLHHPAQRHFRFTCTEEKDGEQKGVARSEALEFWASMIN